MHLAIRRRPVFMVLALGLCAAITTLGAPQADAFKTFRAFGGAIHEAITLEAIGNEVSTEAFRIIDGASTSQDIPGTKHFEDPSHHFVDGSLRPSIRHSQEMWRKAKEHARDADRDRKLRGMTLQHLGFMFHTIQDFYAHSNYVEMALQTGVPPDRIGPMNWESPNPPANLKTGYFFYENIANNELTRSRATAIRYLRKTYLEAIFWTDETYAQMRSDPASYQQAIAYATSGRAFLHIEVEKDNASSRQGKVVHPGSGLTLHEIARRVAVKDTRRLWHTFLNEVKRDAGDRGGAITAAISGHAGLVCPRMLAGHPLTRKAEYQGGIKIQKNGTFTAHCSYGDEAEIHVTVLWAERPVANVPCATMREFMAKMNSNERGTIVQTYASAARWAAVSFSTKLLRRTSEIRGLADELLKQVELRALQCS